MSDHLAFWDSPTPATNAEGRRLFYAYVRHSWFRNDPDYRPVAETENLRNFIRDLKAAFPGGDDAPWDGDFSAKERFVIASLRDGKRKKVWKEACRLARIHCIICYDPQADRTSFS